MLAVIGLGSIGSMALWQASRLSDSVTGFEAASPAHGRSTVGCDTRLYVSAHDSRPSDSFLRLSEG
jgi:sarcosine oxidase